MTEEDQAKKMAQYELELKLDRMTQRAFPNPRQAAPKKPLTTVDAEVIKEYQKQFNEPSKELQYDINEETGEQTIRLLPSGKPDYKISKKFRVVPPPELDVVDDKQFYTIPTDAEKEEMYNTLQEMKAFLEAGNVALPNLVKQRKFILDIIDNLPSPQTFINEPSSSGRFIMRANPNYERQRLQVEAEKERMLNKKEKIDRQIALLTEEIKDITDLYNNLTSEYQKIDSYKSMNEAEIAKVKQTNISRVKNYQDTLNLMNRGAFIQEQMPNESEEDYIERLQANAEEEYVDETKFEAEMDINRRFKQSLKSLVRDDIIIEQIANSIGSDEEGILIKTEILKRFPLFKKKFIELYGINNKSVTVNDIKNFIDAFISSLKGDNSLMNYVGAAADFKETKTLAQEEQNEEKVFKIVNPTNNKKLYLRVAEFINDNGEETLAPLYSFTGKRESYTVLDDETYIDIKNETGITKAFIRAKLGIKGRTLLVIGLQTKIDSTFEDEGEFGIAKIPTNTYNEDGEIYQIGWGIQADEIPKMVDFGKIKIGLNQLFYKNILSVRHGNLGRIAGFPNVKVSDDMVAIIMKLAKGKTVLKQEIDALKKTEQMLYDTLLSVANLHKSIPNNKDKTIIAMKDRLDLIGGSIDAGNDNKSLVKEAYNIVKALKSFGVITNKEATKYLSQF